MKTLGLDIGTTTVSAVVLEDGKLIESVTEKNGYFIQSEHAFEKAQDVRAIRETALGVVASLFAKHETITRIGITGQMHGILYLNDAGEPVSPLYTWQDGRGDERTKNGKTYAETISEKTGYAVATGYGTITHVYNLENGLVPENAVVFCTIHDYIAMLLSGRTRPVTDATDAASLGLFDVKAGCFDMNAITRAGISPAILPEVATSPVIGRYLDRADVTVAIGDNQASFLGALSGKKQGMLINVGTGSQFSAYSSTYIACDALETRPFPGGGYLLVGASLCGGRAYALLADFFRKAGEMMGVTPENVYAAMDALAALDTPLEDVPTVSTLFSGTRKDPTLRGAITGLSTENFTPRHLIVGMMEGMASELYTMYESYLAAGGEPLPLYGSGNGLRKNDYLQKCFARLFGEAPVICSTPEEAATGAALFAILSK